MKTTNDFPARTTTSTSDIQTAARERASRRDFSQSDCDHIDRTLARQAQRTARDFRLSA